MSCIKINQDKCKSCYLCIKVCPMGLIKKSSVIGDTGECLVEFNNDNFSCLGCAMCATVCPSLAIEKVEKV